MTIRRTVRATSLLNRDRPRRTLAHGFFYLCPQIFRWRFDQDLQRAVVVDLEYLRGRLHTEAVEVANAHVHNDLHGVQPYHGAQQPPETGCVDPPATAAAVGSSTLLWGCDVEPS